MKNSIFLLVFLFLAQTINIHSQVALDWFKKYHGPGNGIDAANSLAVDAAGNVFVTGQSIGDGTGFDYATIKYSFAGEERWVQRYNGTANNYDEARSIVIDALGYVCVTGLSTGGGTNYDYATIKYDTDGTLQWIQRYNGPGNGADFANCIVVDASNSFYVTGGSTSASSDLDYFTIKYHSNGSVLWSQRFDVFSRNDFANSIAVHPSGYFYVTGSSDEKLLAHSFDYFTQKCNNINGQFLIGNSYNGLGNGVDEATTVKVDALGNIYITGYSLGAGTNYDYYTIKYSFTPNSSLVVLWGQRYNGSGNGDDVAKSLAVDNFGNVFVTGYSAGAGSNFDYVTVKYNSLGVQQWVQRFNGAGNDTDRANSIALDAAGNVYVTGESKAIGSGFDCVTIKYSTAGAQQWVQQYAGTGDSFDGAKSIVVYASGIVYVSGVSDEDYITLKYIQPIGIEPISTEIPNDYGLLQNYPNPFNPVTNVRFQIPKTGFVNLKIYDVLGGEAAYLVNEQLNPGTYEVNWNAASFPSGVYYYKLVSGNYSETKKMVLVK